MVQKIWKDLLASVFHRVYLARLGRRNQMRFYCYWLAAIALIVGASLNPQTAQAESLSLQTSGEVYRTPDGENYAALGVRLSPGQIEARQPAQVLLLVDTSASQVGEFRKRGIELVGQVLGRLTPEQQVDVWVVDVDQTSVLSGLTQLDREKIASVSQALNRRIPAGATDLPAALEKALETLDPARSAAVIYVGDGYSAANLVSSQKMKELSDKLASRRVPIISYVIGAQTDYQLLGAIALRSGGVVLSELPGQSSEQAAEKLVSATQAEVWYPESLRVSHGLQLLPHTALPVRSDRETFYLTKFPEASLPAASLILSDAKHSGETAFKLSEQAESTAALRAMWLRADKDSGLSQALAGQVVMRAAKTSFEDHVAAMLNQANDAANRGKAEESLKISQVLQQFDPLNKAAAQLIKIQQVALLQEESGSATPPIVSELNELEQGTRPPTDIERDAIERYKNLSKVAGERLGLQVNEAINQARLITEQDPEVAISVLKGVQGAVRTASDIDPEVRRELIDVWGTSFWKFAPDVNRFRLDVSAWNSNWLNRKPVDV